MIIAIIIFLFLLFLIIYLILKGICSIYVKKHKETLFEKNKFLSSQCKELGTKVENKMPTYDEYINDLDLNKVHYCSSSVVSNASMNEIKYLIKYSNLENNMECLEKLEYCINFIDLHCKFCNKMEELKEQILYQLPKFIKIFINKKKIPFIVCDIKYELSEIDIYTFQFLYVSPAGKSYLEYSISITKEVLELLRSELYEKINKKGHSKLQRSAMTNDLRESIKKRDNYTFCICGNSVFNEPNLLLEVDHIIPISKGGKTEANNLQTLCWRCNREKSNK